MNQRKLSAHESPPASAEGRGSLSADDWARAALDALAVGGLDAVAVEPLARQLGVTKGSFYWHFRSRAALLRAALEAWEQTETEAAIRAVDVFEDPYERIVQLFKRGNTGSREGRLYLALAAASDDPIVGAAVHRVSSRRLTYLQACYGALGLEGRDARLWSAFAYATFIGNQQLHRDAPEHFPEGDEFRRYFRLMLTTLVPRPQGKSDGPSDTGSPSSDT